MGRFLAWTKSAATFFSHIQSYRHSFMLLVRRRVLKGSLPKSRIGALGDTILLYPPITRPAELRYPRRKRLFHTANRISRNPRFRPESFSCPPSSPRCISYSVQSLLYTFLLSYFSTYIRIYLRTYPAASCFVTPVFELSSVVSTSRSICQTRCGSHSLKREMISSGRSMSCCMGAN